MVVSSKDTSFGEVVHSDYESSWAKKEITYMMEKDIISGYPDKSFRPEKNMKKAEFYKLINKLMGISIKSEVEFDDVKSTDWYYAEIEKGIGAKYLSPSKSLNPKDNISREEVVRIIGKVYGIEKDEIIAEEFVDVESLSQSLKGIIGGLKKKDFIAGYPDKTFRPKAEITRGEVVKILYDISGEIINEAGRVNTNVKTNLVVNVGDVILKDMIIQGDLYLTEGIGEGDIILDNVEIKGNLNIKGGGPNSINIKNSKINTILVDKELGLIRTVFENTKVNKMTAFKEAKIELKNEAVIKLAEIDGKIEIIVEKGSSILNLNSVSEENTIDSKGTIESIKSRKDMKINGEIVKGNNETKIKDGKIIKNLSTIEKTDSVIKNNKNATKKSSGSNSSQKPNLVVLVTSINITGKDKLVNGDTIQLSASIRPSNSSNKKLIWSVVSGPGTIDENGLLTATGVGKITVKALTKDGSKIEDIKEIIATLTELAEAKRHAKEKLNNYVIAEDYKIKKDELRTAILAGEVEIDKATTIDEVEMALLNVKKVIDLIKSDIQIEEELNDQIVTNKLILAKSEKKALISIEAPEAKYTKNKEAYKNKVVEVKAEIDALETVEAVKNYNVGVQFAGIRTDADIVEEALSKATNLVEIAEESKTDADRTAAQNLVTALPDGDVKISLQKRLDKIVIVEDDGGMENPIELISITIDGNYRVGENLEAKIEPTNAKVTYQWKICDTVDGDYKNIEDSNEDTYTANIKDQGKFIKVQVNGIENYTGTQTSISGRIYVLVKNDHFSGNTDGEFKYTGKYEYIEIPHIIRGVPLTSYKEMFIGTFVKGVKSSNENITDMSYMFFQSRAESLDLSRLYTSSATNMSHMFNQSYAKHLDISSFNTSNVTDMNHMFFQSKAISLDLSEFNTSKVMNMSYMFMNYPFIKSEASVLDISSFDTSKVVNMKGMFSNSKVTSLDLSNFDTSNVTDMESMFSNSQTISLDLRCFDTSKVTNMEFMFYLSKATTGYARTPKDAKKFNESSNKPSGLKFIIKTKVNLANESIELELTISNIGKLGTYEFTVAKDEQEIKGHAKISEEDLEEILETSEIQAGPLQAIIEREENGKYKLIVDNIDDEEIPILLDKIKINILLENEFSIKEGSYLLKISL